MHNSTVTTRLDHQRATAAPLMSCTITPSFSLNQEEESSAWAEPWLRCQGPRPARGVWRHRLICIMISLWRRCARLVSSTQNVVCGAARLASTRTAPLSTSRLAVWRHCSLDQSGLPVDHAWSTFYETECWLAYLQTVSWGPRKTHEHNWTKITKIVDCRILLIKDDGFYAYPRSDRPRYPTHWTLPPSGWLQPCHARRHSALACSWWHHNEILLLRLSISIRATTHRTPH